MIHFCGEGSRETAYGVIKAKPFWKCWFDEAIVVSTVQGSDEDEVDVGNDGDIVRCEVEGVGILKRAGEKPKFVDFEITTWCSY